MRYDFTSASSWPSNMYARLALTGGQITYVDAVCVEAR